MDIADQNLMGMDSFGGSTYAPQRSMNQPPMYGMGGMPFGGGYGGYGGFGGFGGGYGGGFNPMFGGIGGLGFNPMFGPGFGQPMSPFGGGMGRNFGGFGGGFGGYPQFGGFGGGFGGYPQFGGFGGFGGFNPMFGGIGGLGFNPFMGPEFGRRMPQTAVPEEGFERRMPGFDTQKFLSGAAVEDYGTPQDQMPLPAVEPPQSTVNVPSFASRDHGPREHMYSGGNDPMKELASMFPFAKTARSGPGAAPSGMKWMLGHGGYSLVPEDYRRSELYG